MSAYLTTYDAGIAKMTSPDYDPAAEDQATTPSQTPTLATLGGRQADRGARRLGGLGAAGRSCPETPPEAPPPPEGGVAVEGADARSASRHG
jgi:hypothetical protein